jgi:hypothetical protein
MKCETVSTVFTVKEPDALLNVFENELPSKEAIIRWIEYFSQPWAVKEDRKRQYLELSCENARYIAKLLAYAGLGTERRFKAKELAKLELAEMLRSLARQIDGDLADCDGEKK